MAVSVTCGADIIDVSASLPRLNSLTAVASGGSGPTSYQWTMLSVPIGSSANVGVNNDFTNGVATIQNPQFTSDVDGSYVCQCVAANAGGVSDPTVDREHAQQNVVIRTATLGLKIPNACQYDWALYMNETIRLLETLVGGGPHAPTHLSGAADEVDGDRIDIDYTPVNYVPSVVPPEVTLLVELTAHLAGMDTALGAAGVHRGAGAGLVLNANDIDAVANADGSIVVNPNDIQVGVLATDAQHGVRGGGTQHAVATPILAGFLSAPDKTKLDALVDPNLVDPKNSVRLLTTSNVATLSGNQTVDGVLTAPGERVALFGQSTTTQDGLYLTNAGAWTRTTDFQLGSGQAGAVIPVEEGASNADSIWLVTNDVGTDIVGTHDLAALKFAAGTPRGAGAGLVLNGNDLDAVAHADGSIVVNANDIQVGVITEAQHGDQPLNDGLQHAVATVALNGYMSAADKTKLDGLSAVDFSDENNILANQVFGQG